MSTRYEDLQSLHHITPTNPVVFDKRIYNVDDTIHWHENIEILYFFGGECEVLNGDEILHAKKGDIIVLNSGCVHSVMCKNSKAEFACIIIDHLFCESLGFSVSDAQFTKCFQDAEMAALIEKIVNEPKDDELFSQTISVSTLSILLLLFKNYKIEEAREYLNSGKIELVKTIIKYIKRHYAERIMMDDIEKHCGYSKYYLSRVFKETCQKTIMGYLNEVRINKAKELLVKTDLDIKTVAESCGFECQSYFGKVFKKSEGRPPLSFRNFKEN